MPYRLPSDLLQRSARESVRLLALSYLDEIDAAESRLGDPGDREALHDFRVGLRRLRSALSAYRDHLRDSITGKMRRRIRDLARATGPGRDAEVQLLWLRGQDVNLSPDDKPGYFWLLGRVEGRKQETHDPVLPKVARRYREVGGKFRRELGTLRIELGNGRPQHTQTFGMATGQLIRLQVGRLQEALGRVRDSRDYEQVHQTRITLKRLRYLIEPVARGNRQARVLIRRLKEGQDLLGGHHDLHVLAGEIESLHLDEGSHSRLEPGLTRLAGLAQASAIASFERFQAVWAGELGNRILARAAAVGQALEKPSVAARTQEHELEPSMAADMGETEQQPLATSH